MDTKNPASRIDLEALTFDDVLLQPAYSEVLPRQVDLRTPLTARITLNIPLLSAAMDTVTEAGLAIALAQEGGIGIIHKNMTPARQAAEVRAVKKYESGIIADPITVPPGMTIADVLALTRANHISGVPVVDGDKLVGIVTSRDLRFENAHGSAGVEDHDPAAAAGDGQGRRAALGSDRTAARAPHRKGAGGQRGFPAARHDHGEGHPEVHRTSAGLQGRSRSPARRCGGWYRCRYR